MRYPRLFVLLSAALYGAVGLEFFLAPTLFSGIISLDLSHPDARTDIRAVYGGLDLGMAAFLLWSSRADHRLLPGVVASTFGVCGLGSGRILGMLLDGITAIQVPFLALEVATFAAGLLAWRHALAAERTTGLRG